MAYDLYMQCPENESEIPDFANKPCTLRPITGLVVEPKAKVLKTLPL